MRILFTVDYPWWNGSAYYGVTMAQAMAGSGHDVRVVGRAESPPVERAIGLGLQVVTGVDLRERSVWKLRGGVLALRGEIDRFDPDVIISHDGASHTLSCAAAMLAGKRPLQIRGRGDIRPPSDHPLSRWLYTRRTDAFLLSGEFMIRRGDFGGVVGREMIHVVYPSIDVAGYEAGVRPGSLREELGIPEEAPLAGIVARYDPVKGHETLIGAARALRSRFPEARFLSSGAEENIRIEQLRKMSVQMDCADVYSFLDRRGSSAEIISSLDVGVIASRGSEAVCRVLLEYMVAGVPVVATSVGVIPEVLEDGVTGFLVPQDNPEEMAQKLGRLMEDRDLRERMGKEGRKRVEERYSLGCMAARLDEILAGLADRTGGG